MQKINLEMLFRVLCSIAVIIVVFIMIAFFPRIACADVRDEIEAKLQDCVSVGEYVTCEIQDIDSIVTLAVDMVVDLEKSNEILSATVTKLQGDLHSKDRICALQFEHLRSVNEELRLQKNVFIGTTAAAVLAAVLVGVVAVN